MRKFSGGFEAETALSTLQNFKQGCKSSIVIFRYRIGAWVRDIGGHSLIKVTGGQTLRLLHGEVQQLKFLLLLSFLKHQNRPETSFNSPRAK